jgi:hypothetical protein
MNEAQAAQVIQRRWKKKKSELDLFVVVNKHVDNIETIWDEVDKLDENDIENFMHGVNGKKINQKRSDHHKNKKETSTTDGLDAKKMLSSVRVFYVCNGKKNIYGCCITNYINFSRISWNISSFDTIFFFY